LLDGECEVFDGNKVAVLLAHAACFDCRAHPLITPRQVTSRR
jgi:hypothetical protein